jgi:hypothetical protein
MMDILPYVSALKTLPKKKFKHIKEQDMTECAICMCEYNPDEDIAELKCNKKHYFHSSCLEEWLK